MIDQLPATTEALSWLQAEGVRDAAAALAAAGGNTGQAQAWAREGTLERRLEVRRDLAALAAGVWFIYETHRLYSLAIRHENPSPMRVFHGSITYLSLLFLAIAIDQLEKITNANVDSIRYYSDVNIRQLRAMASIHDLDSLRQFITGTISLTGEIATRMINDSQKSISIGTEIRDAVLSTAQQRVAPEKKPAGKRSAV